MQPKKNLPSQGNQDRVPYNTIFGICAGGAFTALVIFLLWYFKLNSNLAVLVIPASLCGYMIALRTSAFLNKLQRQEQKKDAKK